MITLVMDFFYRIAIQGHWNSFKETANRISVEERGKGVQDDLVVAAR